MGIFLAKAFIQPNIQAERIIKIDQEQGKCIDDLQQTHKEHQEIQFELKQIYEKQTCKVFEIEDFFQYLTKLYGLKETKQEEVEESTPQIQQHGRKRSTTIIKHSEHENVLTELKKLKVSNESDELKLGKAFDLIDYFVEELKQAKNQILQTSQLLSYKESDEKKANEANDINETSRDLIKARRFIYCLGLEFAKTVSNNKERINEISIDYYNKIPSNLRHAIENCENVDHLQDEPYFETNFVKWLVEEESSDDQNSHMNLYHCTKSLLEQRFCRKSRRNTKVSLPPPSSALLLSTSSLPSSTCSLLEVSSENPHDDSSNVK